ncbi:hypothetical protein HDU86_006457 [Geranomyces michiganensis]|nr:hypothetical protein HDU86_006457 [Geranomyces michiganensis]
MAAAAATCCSSPQLGVLDDSGETVCTACGHVLTDYVLHLETDSFSMELARRHDHYQKRLAERYKSHGYPKTRHPRVIFGVDFNPQILLALSNALAGLSLSSLFEGVLHLYRLSKTELRLTRSQRHAKLAVCTWKLARSKGMIIFFPKVLEHFDINKQEFTAALRRIHSHQPSLCPAPAPSVFMLDTYLPKLSERFSFGTIKGAGLRRSAEVILKAAKRSAIDLGRQSAVIEGAAFWLAYEAAVRRRAPLGVPAQIADLLCCPRQSLTVRHGELQQMLALCADAFPFLSDVAQKSKFYKTLPELLLALTPEVAEPSSRPLALESVTGAKLDKTLVVPAFAFAARSTHVIQERIQRAQLRVQQLYAGEVESAGEHSDEGDLDDSDDSDDDSLSSCGERTHLQDTPNSTRRDHIDRRIEQALLDGHAPANILNFKHRIARRQKFDPSLPSGVTLGAVTTPLIT